MQKTCAPAPAHGNTPLSFLTREEWFLSQFWASYSQVLQDLHILPLRRFNTANMDHFPSIDFPKTDLKWSTIGGIAIALYSCIFMAAWTSDFPTSIERKLWKASSVMCLSYGIIGGHVAYVYHHGNEIHQYMSSLLGPPPDLGDCQRDCNGQIELVRRERSHASHARSLRHINQWFDWMRNNSPGRDPVLAIPLRWWIPTTLLCVTYCFSRAYILTEDVISLRRLPENAYETMDWGPYSLFL